MKKLVIALACAVLAAGCGSNAEQKEVAQKALDALRAGDLGALNAVAEKEFNQFEILGFPVNNGCTKAEVDGVKVDGDSAEVTVNITAGGVTAQLPKPMKLKKVGETWKFAGF